MMGLEEHLIGMFRGDAEFHEDAAPSHLGRAGVPARAAANEPQAPETHDQEASSAVVLADPKASAAVAAVALAPSAQSAPGAQVLQATWGSDAEKELKKIPFFVRGKAKRNTELYARERGVPVITVDTLYDAKAHFSR